MRRSASGCGGVGCRLGLRLGTHPSRRPVGCGQRGPAERLSEGIHADGRVQEAPERRQRSAPMRLVRGTRPPERDRTQDDRQADEGRDDDQFHRRGSATGSGSSAGAAVGRAFGCDASTGLDAPPRDSATGAPAARARASVTCRSGQARRPSPPAPPDAGRRRAWGRRAPTRTPRTHPGRRTAARPPTTTWPRGPGRHRCRR